MELPVGCPFAPRCDYREDACESGMPAVEVPTAERAVRCINWRSLPARSTGLEPLRARQLDGTHAGDAGVILEAREPARRLRPSQIARRGRVARRGRYLVPPSRNDRVPPSLARAERQDDDASLHRRPARAAGGSIAFRGIDLPGTGASP